MSLKSFCTGPKLLIIVLCFFVFYYSIYYNVYEYIQTVPFVYFQYPLEIDLKSVVDKTLNGQTTRIQPLNERHSYPFVLNCDKKCKDDDGNQDDVYLLMLIKSRLQNFEQRQIIRRSWGRQYGMEFQNVRRVFLLGVDPSNKALQHRIGLEHQDYDDIAQQFFVDSYFNNTLKMVMGFQWAVEFCSHAKFIAFFDDDYYVNVNRALEMLQRIKDNQLNNLIIGYVWRNAMPIRLKDSKWYISLDEYPYRFWPDYVTAGSFFVPMLTAERLYAAMQFVKIIRFDDVYLGIVAYKLGVTLFHNDELLFYEMVYDKFKFRKIIAAHGFKNPEILLHVWKEQRELDKIP